MIASGYISFVVELTSTFQCLRDYYINGGLLNALRAYFVLYLDVTYIVTSKLINRITSRQREPERDEKILSDHRQDGNDEVRRL